METSLKATPADAESVSQKEEPLNILNKETLERIAAQERDDAWRLQLRSENKDACASPANETCGSNSASPTVAHTDGVLDSLRSLSSPPLVKREKSVVKVQKFVNRLKRFTEADKDAVLQELQKLDVSMHLSEVSDAMCESTMRLKDVPALVEICSLLFQQYQLEFSGSACTSILKAFRNAATDLSQTANNVRRRSLSRLMVDLVLVDVIPESQGLPGIFNDLCDPNVPQDASQDKALWLHNIGTLELLCRKYDVSILGDPGFKQQALENAMGHPVQRQCLLSKGARSAVRAKLIAFYRHSAVRALEFAHTAVVDQSNANQLRRINRGAVDADSEAKYSSVLMTFNRVKTQLESLADLLGQPPPQLDGGETAESGLTRMAPATDATTGVIVADKSPPGVEEEDAWDDETQRDFYENILNLADAVPAVLLGQKTHTTGGVVAASSSGTTGVAGTASAHTAADAAAVEGSATGSRVAWGTVSVFEETPVAKPSQEAEAPAGGASSASTTGVSPAGAPALLSTADHKHLLLDQFFSSLCKATSASEVDMLAMKYFYDQLHVGKSLRKKTVKLLLSSHRNDLHVLPSFGRFLATIAPFCKDVVQNVCDSIQKEFHDLLQLKDALKLETQIKTARYLGELCKFCLIPTGAVLDALGNLFDEFSQNNVETACHLIQSCGRFLICFRGVAERFKNILQKMLRMKNHRNLPVHLEVMVEDSYFQLFPAEGRQKKKKHIPLARQFIQHLIHIELIRRGHDDRVLRSIRRLNWEDPDVEKWLRKAILTATNHVAYPFLGNIASLLCALAPRQPDFVISCVDDFLESVQLSLERNDYRESPHRIRIIKLVGELFNYRLLDTSVILQTLYHLIGFGGPSSYGAAFPTTAHHMALVSGNQHLILPVLSNDREEETKHVGGVHSTSDVLSGVEDEQSIEGALPKSPPTLLREPTAPEDSPGDFFRIRLVCVLLHTCGQFFQKGTAKERMDRFLLFFQRYVFTKTPLSMAIRYLVLDAFEALRPKTPMLPSLAAVDAAIIHLFRKELLLLEEQRQQHLQASGAHVEEEGDGISRRSSTGHGDETEEALSQLGSSAGDDRSSLYSQDEDQDVEEEDLSAGDPALDSFDAGESEDDDREDDDGDEPKDGDDEDQAPYLQDSDDEVEATAETEAKRQAALEAQMFDLELARLISQSVQEAAKSGYGVAGQRSRFDAPDIRLPTGFFKGNEAHHGLVPQQPPSGRLPSSDTAANKLRVRLITRKTGTSNKINVKLFDIPKQSRLCHAVYAKETEDAKEHERLKRFVIDSVARNWKQEVSERENEMRQHLFTNHRHRGGGGQPRRGAHHHPPGTPHAQRELRPHGSTPSNGSIRPSGLVAHGGHP